MITSNVITRTFHIKWRDSTGTAFTIDHDNRQYLITARHVINGIANNWFVYIYHDNQWKHIGVEVVGIGADNLDVAVLSCPLQLSPQNLFEATAQDLGYSQQVYFVGFPLGLSWNMKPFTNQSFPAPFVKAGIFSGALDDNSLFLIDGHNNEGFSGGPVVFQPDNQPPDTFRVAGVVCSYPCLRKPITNKCGHDLTDANDNPIGYYGENTGFVVAVNIKHAIEIIDANPIGFELPNA